MMLDLAQNSPPRVKIPTPTIHCSAEKQYIYCIFKQNNRTPPITKNLTHHIVHYKCQQRSLQR